MNKAVNSYHDLFCRKSLYNTTSTHQSSFSHRRISNQEGQSVISIASIFPLPCSSPQKSFISKNPENPTNCENQDYKFSNPNLKPFKFPSLPPPPPNHPPLPTLSLPPPPHLRIPPPAIPPQQQPRRRPQTRKNQIPDQSPRPSAKERVAIPPLLLVELTTSFLHLSSV